MDRKTSVRQFTPKESMGTDARDQIKGEGATKTKAQSETNQTQQYTTAAPERGDLGGENTNS